MKNLLLLGLLIGSVSLFAQAAIPSGTILPVELNSSIRSNKAKPGDSVRARVMQDVTLAGGMKIRRGAKVVGQVIAARGASQRNPAEISLRFDTVINGSQRIPVVTNLRALATMMDVSEAQLPENGPDRGTSEFSWTTDQIGGEVAYHGGVGIVHGSDVVGQATLHGALVRVSAQLGTKCRGEVEGNDRLQATWVFSSDACGLYDFPEVSLAHSGRSDPAGVITLVSNGGNINIRAGSGMLLRVNRVAPQGAR